jgi:peroxiredoxin
MKLTNREKELRKQYKTWLENSGGYIEVRQRHTFVIVPRGNTAHMSCAILNPADKYKRKYGEYLALRRMFYDRQYVLVPVIKSEEESG